MLHNFQPQILFGNSSGATVDLMSTNFGLYVRKSSEAEDRQVGSIESQVKEMQKRAQNRGLLVVNTYSESRSAKTPGRPEFGQMLSDISNGLIDGIVCWKLNRLARNPIDGANIIWLMQQHKLKQIVTSEGDFNCTDNMMMLYVHFGQSSQFSIDLATDTIRGQTHKAEMGWMPTCAPIGYLNEKYADKGQKRILPDPEQFDKVKQLWLYFLKYEPTMSELLAYGRGLGIHGRNKGHVPLPHSVLFRMLRNPFYCGEFNFRGQIMQGSHQPMITKAQFLKAQEILNQTCPPRLQTKHQFKYRGLIRCGECGAAVTAESHTKTTPNGTRTHTYYRCTRRSVHPCLQKAITEAKLQIQMERLLAKRGILRGMKEGTLELRMTNLSVRAVKLRKPVDPSVGSSEHGLNRASYFIGKVKRMLNDF